MTYVAIVAIFVLIVLLLDAALENREVDRSTEQTRIAQKVSE